MRKWKILAYGLGLKQNQIAHDLLLQEWKELSINSEIVFVEEDNSTITTQIIDADLVIIMKSYLHAELLKLVKKLKGIVKFGVGVNRIDVDYASGKGIIGHLSGRKKVLLIIGFAQKWREKVDLTNL